MVAVGFDIISGKPRLIFFDPVEFQRGIGLVLAIGIYGIGEMLWTIGTKGKVEADAVRTTWADLQKLMDQEYLMTNTWINFRFLCWYSLAAGATPASLMSMGWLFRKIQTALVKVTSLALPPLKRQITRRQPGQCTNDYMGIPGSPTTAILLGGMIMGLRPGPLLLNSQTSYGG